MHASAVNTDREQSATALARRDMGGLIEQLRDAAIAEAVRHREDRVRAVLVAEDVVQLHAQRHRRGISVVMWEEQPQLRL